MKAFRLIMISILERLDKISWSIIRDLQDGLKKNQQIEISIIDNNLSEFPLKKHLGYVCLKPNASNELKVYQEYSNAILSLIDEFSKNEVALANLFIVVTRTSCTPKYCRQLLLDFIEKLNSEQREKIFWCIINSLNDTIRNNYQHLNNEPKTVDSWKKIIAIANSVNPRVLPYDSILELITNNSDLPLETAIQVHPVIVAMMINFYKMKIHLTKSDSDRIETMPEKVITLIVIYIIKGIRDSSIIKWLSGEVITSLMTTHWRTGGRELLKLLLRQKAECFDASSKDNINAVFSLFINMFRSSRENSDYLSIWFSKLRFPDDHITMTYILFESTKDDMNRSNLDDIPKVIHQKMLCSILDSIKKPEEMIREIVVNKQKHSIFNLYSLDTLYQSFLTLTCYLLITSKPSITDDIRNICYDYKKYFYCDYEVQLRAEEFVEFIFLTMLSIVNLSFENIESGETQECLQQWKSLVKEVSEIVLYPYIASAERNGYIWNPDYDFGIDMNLYSKRLLNEYLHKLSKSNFNNAAKDLFSAFKKYKTAIWPYERWEEDKTI